MQTNFKYCLWFFKYFKKNSWVLPIFFSFQNISKKLQNGRVEIMFMVVTLLVVKLTKSLIKINFWRLHSY